MRSAPPKQPPAGRGTQAAPRTQTARRDAAPRKPLTDLKVSFAVRMKPYRVYPLVVEVPRSPGAQAPTEPVIVRPLIPGAHVVPGELKLDVSKPGNKVTFSVAPVARGALPGARLQVEQPGQPVQEIPLRKGGSILFALFVFILGALLGALFAPSLAPFFFGPESHSTMDLTTQVVVGVVGAGVGILAALVWLWLAGLMYMLRPHGIRVVSQTRTLVLLVVALVVPGLIAYYTSEAGVLRGTYQVKAAPAENP